jgi:type IV secretion system protein VirB2
MKTSAISAISADTGKAVKRAWTNFSLAAFAALVSILPTSVWAATDPSTAAGSDGAVCKFFGNINGILNIASIAVVTIAICFAGYQIAFAHKRISDVAGVLIGAVFIGGAAQFAKMILPDMDDQCSTITMIVVPYLFG